MKGSPGDGDQMPKAAGCLNEAHDAGGESMFAPAVSKCHKEKVFWRSAALVVALAVLAPSPSVCWARGGQSMDDAVVPSELAEAVVGVWHLGDSYLVILSRSGKGLRVHQEAEVRIKGKVTRDCAVEYDPANHLLQFPGVGAIHRTIITLRRSDGPIEYSFRSELAPGKWTVGPWEKARRN
jgi:hypothetical protein